MGQIPPNIPGQKEPFLWGPFWLVILFIAVAALPAAGIAIMLIECVYPGRW